MDNSLSRVYDALYSELKVYEKPPLVARIVRPNRYDLWSEVPVVVNGKKRPDMYFASIITQSTYVGFYFMPVYTHEEAKELFHPDLMKLLKGKSCFHITSLDNYIITHVHTALQDGHKLYKARGWV